MFRSHEEEPRAATKPYDDLRKRVLSYFKEMVMDDAFEYAPDEDEYFETGDYEEQAPHMGFIDEYDERMFWSPLASRDLAAEKALSAVGARGEEQRSVSLFEMIARYEEAFSTNGIESVRVAAKTAVVH